MKDSILFHCDVHGGLKDPEIIFSKNGKYIHKRCRQCSRDKSLFRRIGVTRQQKIQQFYVQNGVCKICQKSFDSKYPDQPWESLYVDHCHSTNVFRGLLCNHCNCAIGKMNEDITLLEKCINYLEAT